MISLRPRSEHRADLDLTPFMDVIFILLIFFIIASAFAVRGLDIDLPSAQSSQALDGWIRGKEAEGLQTPRVISECSHVFKAPRTPLPLPCRCLYGIFTFLSAWRVLSRPARRN